MPLVDSHCHLDYPTLTRDRAGVLERARGAGLVHMVTISTRIARFAEIQAIAAAHAEVSCTLGTHPHHAGEEPDVTTADLVRLAAAPEVVGIGECGLDYFYDKSPREAQQESFRRHLRACLETGLPVVIHTRDAEEDTIRILEEEAGGRGLTGVLHCFSGTPWLARQGVAFGLHVSFSGIVTFKKSETLRAIAAELPADRVLVETDAPYLAPEPHRGKANEPAFVRHTAAVVAAARGLDAEALGELTTANFFRLFSRAAAA